MRQNNLTFVRNVLYSLKKRYGAPADLYHVISVTENSQTGQSIITKCKYHLRRVILLPITFDREMNILGGYKKPTRNLPSEDIDITQRVIIIDKRDLPYDFVYGPTDYLIVHEQLTRTVFSQGERFNIQKAQALEDNISTMITAKYIIGGQRNEIFEFDICEHLCFKELYQSNGGFGSTIGGFPLPFSYDPMDEDI